MGPSSCGKKKKMAKGGMMKEEKMMKREGRGMAKADMQKKMNPGMKKLKEKAPEVAAKMGYKKGGAMKKMAKGGSVKKGCDGVATKGKTKGMMV